jgi:hypothetical protein
MNRVLPRFPIPAAKLAARLAGLVVSAVLLSQCATDYALVSDRPEEALRQETFGYRKWLRPGEQPETVVIGVEQMDDRRTRARDRATRLRRRRDGEQQDRRRRTDRRDRAGGECQRTVARVGSDDRDSRSMMSERGLEDIRIDGRQAAQVGLGHRIVLLASGA